MKKNTSVFVAIIFATILKGCGTPSVSEPTKKLKSISLVVSSKTPTQDKWHCWIAQGKVKPKLQHGSVLVVFKQRHEITTTIIDEGLLIMYFRTVTEGELERTIQKVAMNRFLKLADCIR